MKKQFCFPLLPVVFLLLPSFCEHWCQSDSRNSVSRKLTQQKIEFSPGLTPWSGSPQSQISVKLHPKPKDESAATPSVKGSARVCRFCKESETTALRGVSCQIDPMRMSCITINHHQHISPLIANSFIVYVGIERNFTFLFLEGLLNLPQWLSSSRHSKLAPQFMLA